jgi:hypothetical protein
LDEVASLITFDVSIAALDQKDLDFKGSMTWEWILLPRCALVSLLYVYLQATAKQAGSRFPGDLTFPARTHVKVCCVHLEPPVALTRDASKVELVSVRKAILRQP